MSTLGLIIASLITAQASAPPPMEELYIVDADNVVVRCGADRNFYAFMEAPPQSLVRVKEELMNWGRVPSEGPLFQDAWGWVRHPVDEPGRFKVIDTHSGQTLDTLPVYAPDLSQPDPTKAWRPLCMLPMDASVEILDATTAELDGRSYHFYRVRLPGAAEGWINMANLRPATENEARAWSNQVMAAAPRETINNAETVTVHSETTTEATTPPGTGQPSYLARYLAYRAQGYSPGDDTDTAVEVEFVATDTRSMGNRYFEGLEHIYQSLPATDMSEELASRLWEAYAIVAEEDIESDPDAAQLAAIRMRQLELASCLREQEEALGRLGTVVNMATADVTVLRQSLDAPVEYAVLGRLGVSSIFTGNDGRPVMYRVEDPISGRTLTYLQPNPKIDLGAMMGQWIGVVGPTNFDSRWQVQVINPERVDLVAAATY